MHLNLLAILSLTTLTLASPIAQDTQDATASAIAIPIPSVPISILTVMETAIPASWYEEMFNSASRDSIISEIQAGTMPAWYNSLPASVKAWATSAGSDILDGFFGATATATATGTGTAAGSGSGAANGNDPTHAVTATPVATAATTSGSKTQTTKTSSGSSASETIASTSKSSTPSSSTSTGGAPIATVGIAMGFSGAAGLLGLALAL